MQSKQTTRIIKMRKRILDAATKLFLEKGFSGTSTNEITKEAGISKETLYRYYSRKEDLFVDVLKTYTVEHIDFSMEENMPLITSQSSLKQFLMFIANRIVSIVMDPNYLNLLRIIISEAPRFPEVGELFRSTVPDHSLEYISNTLRTLNKKGMVRNMNYDAAARMFIGSLLTYTLLDGLLKPKELWKEPTSEQVETLVNQFLDQIKN